MMHLDVNGKAAVLEALDEVVLPQRALSIEGDRMKLPDKGAQLRHAAGLRQRLMADVVVEVDLVLDNPDRMIEPERRGLEPAAVGRQEIKPRRGVGAKAREQVVARPLRLEDRQARDVHRRLGCLHVEEERVERGQAFHGVPSAFSLAGACATPSAFRQCTAISSVSSGTRASGRKWPIPGTMRKRAPGTAAAVLIPPMGGTSGSSEPCNTSVGALTRRSMATRLGPVWMAMRWRAKLSGR